MSVGMNWGQNKIQLCLNLGEGVLRTQNFQIFWVGYWNICYMTFWYQIKWPFHSKFLECGGGGLEFQIFSFFKFSIKINVIRPSDFEFRADFTEIPQQVLEGGGGERSKLNFFLCEVSKSLVFDLLILNKDPLLLKTFSRFLEKGLN